MQARILKSLCLVGCLAMAMAPGQAAPVKLHDVQFPEKRPVELSFTATPIAPAAQVSAEVTYRQGQARIELVFDDIKPAILFGGDVTCFVVWAVTRDGQVENLGELLTRKESGKLIFSTGKKNFALMVTAESFFLAGQPSELVAFYNRPSATAGAGSSPFTFDDFADAPRHSMDAIGHIKWDSRVPIELLQARKAYELAGRLDADKHAKRVYIEAGAMLKSANETAASAPKSRELLDYSRRAVALSTEALNISMHRIEALELERQIAERRAETEALERRAAEAEAAEVEARRLAEEVRAEKERTMAETAALRTEKTQLEGAMVMLNQEKNELQSESARLRREKSDLQETAQTLRSERTELETEAQRLQRERDELKGRLQNALSHVAETQESVRGFVVNLPDILFDVNEATLKPEAQVVLAKLAGILLIMPEQSATIEGHTDSTGSAEYNLDLSDRRANAVQYFLRSQGLDPGRLRAVGYGMQQPVADNSTAEGRRRNRRVEIVINAADRTISSN
jgi:outer membrane protein OmpA-like peptidoglycan-associated protein